MQGIIDQEKRFALMRAHTATHLLHAEIAKIVPHTKQGWSFVDQDYLRFDFATTRLFTDEEIHTIEVAVNGHIAQAHKVQTEEKTYSDAIALGAKAFFEDTYGDVVRVVQIGNQSVVSSELCGGTHVSNTREIGAFCIVGQEAVASGIKRIVAYTGPKVLEYISTLHTTLDQIKTHIGVKWYTQIPEKLEKMTKEHATLQQYNESLEQKVITHILHTAPKKDLGSISFVINVSEQPDFAQIPFKTIVQIARVAFSETTMLLYSPDGNFAILGTEATSAKSLAAELHLKWGGNDSLVQGKDPQIGTLVH